MGSYARDFYSPKATQQPTVGDTKFSVISQDHMGWLNCDGRVVPTEDYPLLFRVVGYSFGGSGDQFRLPDMRSRVPGAIGQGSEAGLSLRTLGQPVGKETHTLTIAEMPSHNHGTDASDNIVGNNQTGVAGEHTHTGVTTSNGLHSHTGTTQPGGNAAESENVSSFPPQDDNVSGSGTHTHSFTTDPSGNHIHTLNIDASGNHYHSIATQGGDQPHNNMQPTLFIGNMFIYSGKLHSGSSKWRYANDTNIL